jgi:hypothetical protein
MKKVLFVAAALVVFSLTSCKKDTCTVSGDKTTCGDYWSVDKCSKVQLESFQAACKAAGGKTSTK